MFWCCFIFSTFFYKDPSFSNEVYFALSSGCPFTPFTFTIQPIHRCHSLRVFVHGAGDFEGCITLSGRFRWLSEVSGCDLFSLMSSPSPPTVHQHDDSRVTLTTLPAARVSKRSPTCGKRSCLGVETAIMCLQTMYTQTPTSYFQKSPRQRLHPNH